MHHQSSTIVDEEHASPEWLLEMHCVDEEPASHRWHLISSMLILLLKSKFSMLRMRSLQSSEICCLLLLKLTPRVI